MAKRDRLENMCHSRLKGLRPVTRPHGQRVPQVLTLGHGERKELGRALRHSHVVECAVAVRRQELKVQPMATAEVQYPVASRSVA